MFALVKTIVRVGKPTTHWIQAVRGILDVYLGRVPETFEYEGKTYTPHTFADMLGINPDDYIEITSFMNHPYYKSYVLDSKYNWSHDLYYNVTLDDFTDIINNAIKNGFTVAWDGDVSEKEFSFRDGVALVPQNDWDKKSYNERLLTCSRPEKEKKVTPELRLQEFVNGNTTIDHIMQITGIAVDQSGKHYYYTKNSWGTPNNTAGYMYLSESYIKLKTVAFMVHKDAIPAKIRKKLGL
jgi:bleomycin hydrolase